jgi:7,8-dihydro-6-hydroxymethylpterin-pyrophosphokinase
MLIRLHNSYSYPCAGPDSQDTYINYCSAIDRMVFVHCFKPIVMILVYFLCTWRRLTLLMISWLLIKIKIKNKKIKKLKYLHNQIQRSLSVATHDRPIDMDVLGRGMSRRLTPSQCPYTTESICALHDHLLHAKFFLKRKSWKICTLGKS